MAYLSPDRIGWLEPANTPEAVRKASYIACDWFTKLIKRLGRLPSPQRRQSWESVCSHVVNESTARSLARSGMSSRSGEERECNPMIELGNQGRTIAERIRIHSVDNHDWTLD